MTTIKQSLQDVLHCRNFTFRLLQLYYNFMYRVHVIGRMNPFQHSVVLQICLEAPAVINERSF